MRSPQTMHRRFYLRHNTSCRGTAVVCTAYMCPHVLHRHHSRWPQPTLLRSILIASRSFTDNTTVPAFSVFSHSFTTSLPLFFFKKKIHLRASWGTEPYVVTLRIIVSACGFLPFRVPPPIACSPPFQTCINNTTTRRVPSTSDQALPPPSHAHIHTRPVLVSPFRDLLFPSGITPSTSTRITVQYSNDV